MITKIEKQRKIQQKLRDEFGTNRINKWRREHEEFLELKKGQETSQTTNDTS